MSLRNRIQEYYNKHMSLILHSVFGKLQLEDNDILGGETRFIGYIISLAYNKYTLNKSSFLV